MVCLASYALFHDVAVLEFNTFFEMPVLMCAMSNTERCCS